jgi:hypothetical protein
LISPLAERLFAQLLTPTIKPTLTFTNTAVVLTKTLTPIPTVPNTQTHIPSTLTPIPPKAVEGYLNALVEKDSNRLTALSCKNWEDDALLELDSFQAVTTKLDGMSCQQTGTDGNIVLVLCKGKIIATYNNKNQELDLSTRTYQVVQQGGDWLVCGTR